MKIIGAPIIQANQRASSRIVKDDASNEFVFAVAGHVGSGTTKIANSLRELLISGTEAFDTKIIRARSLIEEWASANGKAIPIGQPGNLNNTVVFQDFCDQMRADGDHAIIARRAIQRIRTLRAKKMGEAEPGHVAQFQEGPQSALCAVPPRIGSSFLPDHALRDCLSHRITRL